MNRLSTLSRALNSQITQATLARRLEAVLSVCDQAVVEIGALDPLILEAMAKLHSDAESIDVSQLSALRERLDNAYFSAQERAEENGDSAALALKFFSAARLAAALELASKLSDAEEASDCLYEALMALNDNQVMIRKLELTIG
jgi:hypothetical protein